jgi:hypothetical protein
MASRDVPVHRLSGNAREWTPGTVGFFDTETRAAVDDRGETHHLRLWSARTVDRRAPKRHSPRDVVTRGTTAADLVAWVTASMRSRRSMWVFAHNLTFDLATTALLRHLTDDGWRVTSATLGGKSCWAKLSKGKQSLTLADSWTYLPVDLGRIGLAVGQPKMPLPAGDDTDAAWQARCDTDVAILAEGMLDFLAWFDDAKLGNLSTTGATTGWNVYRHRADTRPVVIHPEPAVIAEDRTYVHGGRRATWRLGRLTDGPFVELDIHAAYPTVAAHYPLPQQHRATFTSLDLDDYKLSSDRWGVVAECVIRTLTPTVPVKWSGATFYPVGQFRARLCGPDIQAALAARTLISVGPGRTHQLSHSMSPWAHWVLDVMAGNVPNTPEVAQVAAKHWSRSTIGKWAAHSFDTTQLGPSPGSGWGYEDAYDHDNQCRASIQDLAGQRSLISAGGDPENAYPVIFAWVESHIRVALARAVDMIGEGALVTANTDGLIATQRLVGSLEAGGSVVAPDGVRGKARLDFVVERINAAIAPLVLRVKSSAGHVDVKGPQHVVLGKQRTMSGIPRSADQVGPDTFQFLTWPGMSRQLAAGMDGTYRRDQRNVTIAGPFPSGWVLDDGTVKAPEMTTDASGGNVMLPWCQTRWAAAGFHLGPVQRPELGALL